MTTASGAKRLGGGARGLAAWQTTRLEAPERPAIEITATPCRHGPPLSHPIVGDVIGFALRWDGQEHGVLWISGDTVLYDGVRQVADRLEVDTALLHLGGVRFGGAGPLRYTMTARDAVELCGLVAPAHRDPDPLRGLEALPAGARGDRARAGGGAARTSASASAGCRSGWRSTWRREPAPIARRRIRCARGAPVRHRAGRLPRQRAGAPGAGGGMGGGGDRGLGRARRPRRRRGARRGRRRAARRRRPHRLSHGRPERQRRGHARGRRRGGRRRRAPGPPLQRHRLLAAARRAR